MAFRFNESKEYEFLRASNMMTRGLSNQQKKDDAIDFLKDVQDRFGNFLTTLPSWHPLGPKYDTIYGRQKELKGLDHTIYFSSGLITCPYGDGQDVIESAEKIREKSPVFIHIEELEIELYHERAKPIMIYCDWEEIMLKDGTIPLSIAMPLFLEYTLPNWRHAQVGELWETMEYRFLGSPSGKVSSLSVNKATGHYLKKTFEMLNNSGMFGEIYR